MGTILGMMGLGADATSSGLKNLVKETGEKFGFANKTFRHGQRKAALNWLNGQIGPGPVILIGNSMGADAIDEVAEDYGKRVDAAFMVVSAYTETLPENVERVYRIVADKDWRQFKIDGGQRVESFTIDAMHVTADDDEELKVIFWREIGEIIRELGGPTNEKESFMTGWNDFKGASRKLDDIDLPRIGHQIGVGEDEIHAVLDVEARGSGFDDKGRPAMLFEPHVFYRQLRGKQREEAVRQGLAYAKWKRGSYPKDSYPRLIRAMKINETAALKSASWGMGQIMGFNHKAAGYETVQAMVRAFMEDEENHLQAMVDFIKNEKLDDELRRHDWAGFARGYNGEGYAVHDYHGRLERSFNKWKRIKDTPWKPVKPTPEMEDLMNEIINKPPTADLPPEPEPVQPKDQGLKGALSLLLQLIKRIFKGE